MKGWREQDSPSEVSKEGKVMELMQHKGFMQREWE